MKISYKDISKLGVLICLMYVMWYKWVFGDNLKILYFAAAASVFSMIIGLTLNESSIFKIFPFGCFKDIIMCFYSVFTGIFVAISYSALFNTIETYFAFAMVCLACCYASTDTGYDWLLKGFIYIAVLCSLWTMIYGYYRPGYGMVLSETNNPHTLGFVMVLGIFAAAYRSKDSIRSFIWNLLLEILFLFVIIQCGSRKCLIASILVLLPWLWMEYKTILKKGTFLEKMIITLLFLILVIGVVYYYYNTFIYSTSYERMAYIEESQANEARISYFGLGFSYLLYSPILGIGLGQFAILNPNATYSHSTIPEAIASWGIIGSLIYFIPLLLASYRSFILAKKIHDKKAIMIFSLCVMELFMALLQIYFYSLQHMIVWMIIFLYVESHYSVKKTNIKNVKKRSLCQE